MRRIHAFISGRVQGVFFRANTSRKAKELDITGWVRNLPDGRVEVLAEGDDKKIDEFIKFLHKGPPSAKVEDVEIKEQDYKGEFSDFIITH